MPVLYEPYQSTIRNKDGEKLFYPRVVRVGNVSTNQIAKEIAEYSSLSTGDVKNTIDNLVTVMARHLQSSQSVTLDGLGSFRMVMLAGGHGVSTSDEVSASQASLTIRFRPASTRNLDGTVATRSMITGAKCKRYDRLTGETGSEEEPGGSTDPDEGGDNEGNI